MKTEIKDKSGKTLFTAEEHNGMLDINDASGKKLCCIAHDGTRLQVMDANDKIISQIDSKTRKVEKVPM